MGWGGEVTILYVILVWIALALIGAFVPEKSWWHRFAMATDVFFAAILLNRRDVTISSWSGISTSHGAKILEAILCKIQTNHTEIARQSDIDRANAALEYLNKRDLP